MGSPWRDRISLAILELQEKGEIQMLYDKWWKNPGDTCIRTDKSKESKANALGVDNIGGVFVVLLGGLAFAVFIAIVEFCHNAKRQSYADVIANHGGHSIRQSLCAEMSEELCFALRCRGSRQRPALKRTCSKCVSVNLAYVPSLDHSRDSNRNSTPVSIANLCGFIDIEKFPDYLVSIIRSERIVFCQHHRLVDITIINILRRLSLMMLAVHRTIYNNNSKTILIQLSQYIYNIIIISYHRTMVQRIDRLNNERYEEAFQNPYRLMLVTILHLGRP